MAAVHVTMLAKALVGLQTCSHAVAVGTTAMLLTSPYHAACNAVLLGVHETQSPALGIGQGVVRPDACSLAQSFACNMFRHDKIRYGRCGGWGMGGGGLGVGGKAHLQEGGAAHCQVV